MPLDLSPLQTAINALADAITFAHSPMVAKMSKAQQNTIQAGVIQCFEFTYERAWKYMKRWLEHNLGSVYVDGVSRKVLFRLAAEHQLIDDVLVWFEYHSARNKTSHTYAAETAAEVYQIAPCFLQDVQALFHQLQLNNV